LDVGLLEALAVGYSWLWSRGARNLLRSTRRLRRARAYDQAIAYVYSRANPAEAMQAKVLTEDEARRIAVNIAKLFMPFRQFGAVRQFGSDQMQTGLGTDTVDTKRLTRSRHGAGRIRGTGHMEFQPAFFRLTNPE
jgi:hypothetical protein